MSLSEERRNNYTQKPLKVVLNPTDLIDYHLRAKKYYSTVEGQSEIIDTDFHMSDMMIGKVN